MALVVSLGLGGAVVPEQRAVENVYPKASPDGGSIAFMSNGDVHVIDLATRRRSVVVSTPLPEANPDWSPDGTRLVYTAGPADDQRELWIVSISDGGRRRIDIPPGAYSRPAWSPDGDSIAIVAARPRGSRLLLLELSTGRLTALTDGARDTRPAWSPDGTRIAFDRTRDDNTDIFVVDIGSGATERLTSDPAIDANPTWSPTGAAIAFNSNRSGGGDLYSISLATRALTRLTRSPAIEQGPSWSSVGWIAYFSTETGMPEIAILDPSNGRSERLTCGDGVCDARPGRTFRFPGLAGASGSARSSGR